MKSLLYVMIIPLIGLILAYLRVDQSSFWIISFVILVFITIISTKSTKKYNGNDRNKNIKIVMDIINIHRYCYNELITNHFYSYKGRKIIDELELKGEIYIKEIYTYYGVKYE